jgi:hypothetical protein
MIFIVFVLKPILFLGILKQREHLSSGQPSMPHDGDSDQWKKFEKKEGNDRAGTLSRRVTKGASSERRGIIGTFWAN